MTLWLAPVALLIKLALAAMFAFGGFAKLNDRGPSRRMLMEFGAPEWLNPSLVIALPCVELVVALALWLPATDFVGAVAATLLLAIFTTAIGYQLARGRAPTCNCFGAAGAAPISARTLARNVGLTAAAALLAWAIPADRVVWSGLGASVMSDREASLFLALGVIIGLLVFLVFTALDIQRDQRIILARLERREPAMSPSAKPSIPRPSSTGGSIGAPAPDFHLRETRGAMVALSDLLAPGRPLLVLFVGALCPSCAQLVDEARQRATSPEARFRLAVICEAEAASSFGETAGADDVVLIQERREVSDAYGCWGSPEAVVVQPDGALGSRVAKGAAAIRALWEQFSDDPKYSVKRVGAPRAHGVGARPPSAPLARREGGLLFLDDFRGREALVVFWSPDCSFCHELLTQLEAWEAKPPPWAPEVLIIAQTTEDRLLDVRLPGQVVVDPNAKLASALGIVGTPNGVLLDSEGLIASKIAVGAQEIMALAFGVQPVPLATT